MSTRFSSLLSGLALGLVVATPVFAQSTSAEENVERDILMSCREEQVPAYRSSLEGALQELRSSIVNQWKRQVDFRVRAARTSQRAAVQRVLAQRGRELDAALDRFAKAQTDGLEADVKVALDAYLRFEDNAEDQNLERWSDRNVSFQALDTVLARLERSLRTYAVTRDRATITRVWNDTRKQAEGAFSQSRAAARDAFVEEMDACVYAMPEDEQAEQETAAADVKKDDSDTTPAASSKSEDAKFLEVQLARSGAGPISVCGQYTVEYIGYVRMSQPGASFTYHFERSDGARSADQVGTTNASGAANVYYNWTLSRPIYGWVKLVITAPYRLAESPAHATDFTAVEKTGCTPTPPATTTPNQPAPPTETKADARLVVDGKAEVNTCGTYRYTFTGTISYGAAGTVKYYWLRSDGARSADQSVVFEGAGTKTVSQTWDLGLTYSGWIRLMIIAPNETQAQADINLVQTCSSTNNQPTSEKQETPAPANQSSLRAEAMVTSKEEVALCGNYLFQFKGIISGEPGTKVAYYWERSDGVRSPESTLLLESGSYSVPESWNLGGSYAGWVRLHVTYPNEVVSNQASFKITESCK